MGGMNTGHDRSINLAIKKLAGTFSQQAVTFTTGEVDSVNVATRTCVVLVDNGVELTCKLMAQVGDGVLLIPSVGSTVLVAYSTYNNAYVVCYSDLDTIWLKGDEYGGLVRVAELTTKLNNLENKVNALLASYNTHVHTGVTTGPGSSGPTPSQVSGTLTPTTATEISNPNVKHGL